MRLDTLVPSKNWGDAHPLEPLTAREIADAVGIMKGISGDGGVSFVMVTLARAGERAWCWGLRTGDKVLA